MEQNVINQQLGKKIHRLRKEKGLTQQELADRTELTKGFISQLERGQVSPSVVTLLDLIECLGTNPADFFRDAEEEQIVFSDGGYFEKIDENGNSVQWIVPTAQGNQMEPLLVALQPGQSLPQDTPHEGEEFGYILTGRVVIHLGEKSYTAKSGESFYYKAHHVHWLENTSKRPARLIWVSTPPSF